MDEQITVELIYANGYQQWIISLQVPSNTTIEQVIQRSGIMRHCPEIDLSQQRVGIYGCQKPLTETVQTGDRVEIYRPLVTDPREIRRLRALQQNALHPKRS